MALTLGFAGVGFHFHGMSSGLYWAARCLCAVLAIAACVLVMRMSKPIRSLDRLPLPEEKFKLIPLEDPDLLRLKVRAGSAQFMDLAEAQVFALGIIYPAMLRQRVSERHEPERRTIRQSVSIDIKIPKRELGLLNGSSAQGAAAPTAARRISAPVPVLILPKGELNDDLSVYCGDDEPIPTYSYSEYLQLASRALHALLVNACLGQRPNGVIAAAVSDEKIIEYAEQYVQDAEDAALRCIMHRGVPSVDEKVADQENEAEKTEAIKQIRMLHPSADFTEEQIDKSITLLRLAVQLVEKLSTDYAIMVAVPCGDDGRISLRYERIFIPSIELPKRPNGLRKISRGGLPWAVRWGKDRLRFLLGARPVKLDVSLENACTCLSYHMMVACPEGLYLREQEVPGVNDYLKQNARPRNVPPYCRLRRRLGQPYAHFYARYFPEPKKVSNSQGDPGGAQVDLPGPPALRLAFYEVPPASIFRAALVNVSTTLLVWLVGVVISHASNGDPGTDAPAFLLAFPAVIAAWLGFDAPSRRLLEGTLGARLSLMYSAFSAIAASGLFMMYKAQLGFLHGSFPAQLSILGIGQISWAALAALSAVNAIYACYYSIVRSWEFAHLSSRPISHSSIAQGG